MACSKPGRFKLICAQCRQPFSTHSSNRKKCYRCLPKCREIHAFNPVSAKFYAKVPGFVPAAVAVAQQQTAGAPAPAAA